MVLVSSLGWLWDSSSQGETHSQRAGKFIQNLDSLIGKSLLNGLDVAVCTALEACQYNETIGM